MNVVCVWEVGGGYESVGGSMQKEQFERVGASGVYVWMGGVGGWVWGGGGARKCVWKYVGRIIGQGVCMRGVYVCD